MQVNFMNKNPKYAKYKIGRFTYGEPKIEDIWNHHGVTLQIGSFCSIARGVTIWLGGNHHNEWVSTSPLNTFLQYDSGHKFDQTSTKGSVIIGNDVWIGAEASILSGTTIEDGAIIGTKAVVSNNIPPYCVVVGNPARVVKKRFNDEQIQKLLEIKWWNWEDDKIKENIPLILSENVDDFISKFYKKG